MPPERRSGLFPDAWFHAPEELRAEVTEARLEVEALFGVEGPAWLSPVFVEQWENEATRASILDLARVFEQEERAVALSPHLLAVARRLPA